MTWRLGHRPALDGLRGIAVLLVVACHLVDWRWPNALGTVGVTIFFTLSGFLITSLLLQDVTTTGAIRWRTFYARRARRLLPAAVAMVLVVATFQSAAGIAGAGAAIPILGYVANWSWMHSHNLGLMPHTWSLAVEEQFYLVWPMALMLASRFRRSALTVAGVGIAGAIALRLTLWYGGAGWDRVYYGSDTRADALLVGCAVAILVARGWRPRPAVAAASAALAGLIALAAFTSSWYGSAVLLPTVTPWVTAAMIVAVLDRPAWLAGPFLGWWGRRSYGIYLWHYPAIAAVLYFGGGQVQVLIAATASLLIAEASWRYLEQPILRRRDQNGEVRPQTFRLRKVAVAPKVTIPT